MKIINFVRERSSEHEVWVNTFLAEDWVENPEKELREAVKEFLQTKDGLISIKNTCDDYNWGDFMMDLPEIILKRHGLAIQDSKLKSIDIKVNQDEVLCHDINIPFTVETDNGFILVANGIRLNLNVYNDNLSAKEVENIIKTQLTDNLKDIDTDEVITMLKEEYDCKSI